MSKKIDSYIKLTIPAGKANPAPPVGPALGQKGVNIMEFCKKFNAVTSSHESGVPIPAVITVFVDKSFTFVTKSPPASFYLKKFAKVSKGSSDSKRSAYVGKVTVAECQEIAKLKMQDLNAKDLDSATKIIAASAKSMGIEVVS